MTTSDKLRLKYGDPVNDKSFEKRCLAVFEYPEDIKKAIPSLGKSIYCNKDLWPVYLKTLRDLIKKDLHKEIYSNDECFCIRMIRGSADELSTHSWAMAVDLNVKDNPLGKTREEAIAAGLRPFSKEFVQVWRDNNWVCGIDFKRGDGMHFELTKGL
jgi:hypothetical protein